MAGTTWRRHALVVATVAIAAAGLAACGSGGDNPSGTGATSSGDSQLGGAPSGTATQQNQATPAATGNNGPVYPKDAKSYALELLKAYSKADLNRVGQLATSDGLAQIKDSVNSPDKAPNGTWTYISCTPGGANTACVYRNANGDEAEVTMTNAKLGAAGAVTQTMLDRTRFASSVDGYASAFHSAWNADNYQRMVAYSSRATADYFKGRPEDQLDLERA